MDFKKLLALATKNQVKKEQQFQKEEDKRQLQEEEKKKNQQAEPQITEHAIRNHRIKPKNPIVVGRGEAAAAKPAKVNRSNNQTAKSDKTLPQDLRNIKDRKPTSNKKSNLTPSTKDSSIAKPSKGNSKAIHYSKPSGGEKKIMKSTGGYDKTAKVNYKNSINRSVDSNHKQPRNKKVPKLDNYQSLLQYAKEQQLKAEKSTDSTRKESDIRQSVYTHSANNAPKPHNKRLREASSIAGDPKDRSRLSQTVKNTLLRKDNKPQEKKREVLPQKHEYKSHKDRICSNSKNEKINPFSKEKKRQPASAVIPSRRIAGVSERDWGSKARTVSRKRPHYEEYNDLDGFIDDSEPSELPENNISSLISQITGYNPNSEKYVIRERTIRIAESNFSQIQKEEARSSKIGRIEDRIEERKQREEELLAKMKKQRKNAQR
ncbi:hypothetical protein TrispH2_005273 [Trichoplax sp. H2]|nr:hypothetical protein TrispH2_005273 [Trichoplax sp. H2]|eukprot:RDD42846.1 hypothetical protein TrispH2_005273 [Trichoplax sp. H2]